MPSPSHAADVNGEGCEAWGCLTQASSLKGESQQKEGLSKNKHLLGEAWFPQNQERLNRAHSSKQCPAHSSLRSRSKISTGDELPPFGFPCHHVEEKPRRGSYRACWINIWSPTPVFLFDPLHSKRRTPLEPWQQGHAATERHAAPRLRSLRRAPRWLP